LSAFLCKICGDCCKGDGSVFLYPEDIKAIADHLGTSIQDTVNKYAEHVMLEIIEKTGSYLYMPYLILKKKKSACIFSGDNLCEIHGFKPYQCKNTPFVSEFFSDKSWRTYLKKSCPALGNMDEKDYSAYLEIGKQSEEAERSYYFLLRENSFNLEKILEINLSAPRIITQND
jgi:uncharacterized protein